MYTHWMYTEEEITVLDFQLGRLGVDDWHKKDGKWTATKHVHLTLADGEVRLHGGSDIV